MTSRDYILTYCRTLAVDGHYPPQPAQDQTSQRLSHFSDTSIPLFALHLRIADEHDGRRLKLLRADTDQILVFVSPYCWLTYHGTSIAD